MKNSFNKKLLIYIDEKKLNPSGGAAGYNYNLRQGLNEISVGNYTFIKKDEVLESDSFKKRILSTDLGKVLARIIYYLNLRIKRGGHAVVDLNDYDIVHFHNVKDLYCARRSLETYKGIIVLQNHSPKPWHTELYDIISPFEKFFFGWLYKSMSVVDEYAFSKADFIVFPCKEAEEPYFDTWVRYRDIHKENEKKYRYILTGTKQCVAKVSRDLYRKKYDIPEEAFVMSYAGRHNSAKGYDVVKTLGQTVIEEGGYVLVAGKKSPMEPPQMNRWIEIGWTTDPHSLINASDVFVLPNKVTYFDLVMLEVLSLGCIVVASNTGGNKVFSKEKGVFLFDSVEEATDILRKIRNMSLDERNELKRSNVDLYTRLFTNKRFAEAYVEMINEMEK